MSIIKINNLTKFFGKNQALSGVNLEVKTGSITGFLGPNGAGKSTTMNILMGFLSANSGQVEIFGQPVNINSAQIRQNIGFLSNNMTLDSSLTARQEIEYFSHLSGKLDEDYIQDLAKRLDLDLSLKISSLSTGNHQKVALITALVAKPKLLILDEPTNGLDPLVQAEFNKIILDLKQGGSTIFISSHILSEVDELCDEFIFIRAGKIVGVKSQSDIKNQSHKIIRLQAKDSKKIQQAITETIDKSTKFSHPHTDTLEFTTSADLNILLKLLAKHKLSDLTIETESLENSFMKYYEGDTKNA